MLALVIEDGTGRWLESYGLFIATVGLVVATISLTWATAVMAKWMRQEFELKTLPRVVPFGRSLQIKQSSDLTLSQRIVNTGHCAALIEHVDLDVSLKRSPSPTKSVGSNLAMPALLQPGEVVDAVFVISSATIASLGGIQGGEPARIIDAKIHIRSSGPTRKVEENRWPMAIE